MKFERFTDIENWIDANNCVSYKDLCEEARKTDANAYREIVRHSAHFEAYVNSVRIRLEQEARERGEDLNIFHDIERWIEDSDRTRSGEISYRNLCQLAKSENPEWYRVIRKYPLHFMMYLKKE